MTEPSETPTQAEGRIPAITSQLEAAVVRLRESELSPTEAAELIEECARLAGEAGAELEQLAGAGSGISSQQGELL